MRPRPLQHNGKAGVATGRLDQNKRRCAMGGSRFPIDREDPLCSYTCCKCSLSILADPRDVPTQCLMCDAQYSFISTNAYNELMNSF